MIGRDPPFQPPGNSRTPKEAFIVCRVQMGEECLFDLREGAQPVPAPITTWLDVVSPLST